MVEIKTLYIIELYKYEYLSSTAYTKLLEQ